MSGIEFGQEAVYELWDELIPLLQAHEKEMYVPYGMKVDLDVEQVNFFDEQGLLKVYTVRDMGKLIGYAAFLVTPSLMFRGHKQAVPMGVYLDKAHRNGMVGYRFLHWCDEMLRGNNVSLVYHSVGRVDFGQVLVRLGYEFCETTYARTL